MKEKNKIKEAPGENGSFGRWLGPLRLLLLLLLVW